MTRFPSERRFHKLQLHTANLKLKKENSRTTFWNIFRTEKHQNIGCRSTAFNTGYGYRNTAFNIGYGSTAFDSGYGSTALDSGYRSTPIIITSTEFAKPKSKHRTSLQNTESMSMYTTDTQKDMFSENNHRFGVNDQIIG